MPSAALGGRGAGQRIRVVEGKELGPVPSLVRECATGWTVETVLAQFGCDVAGVHCGVTRRCRSTSATRRRDGRGSDAGLCWLGYEQCAGASWRPILAGGYRTRAFASIARMQRIGASPLTCTTNRQRPSPNRWMQRVGDGKVPAVGHARREVLSVVRGS